MGTPEEPVKVTTVESTSRQSAACDDIMLSETSTTRLLFRPVLVENPQNPEACVKGKFIRQRKGANTQWEDTESFNAATLKAGEEINLNLGSAEIHALLKGIGDLRAVYSELGIPIGTTRVAITDSSAIDMLRALANYSDPEKLIELSLKIEPSDLDKIETTLSLARFEQTIKELSLALGRTEKEEWWQRKLAQWPWIIGQLFSQPVVLFAGKAYVGGKGIANTGGELADFLFRNKLTGNVALIEIKTPQTPLLGQPYRQTYSISADLTGAVGQVLGYRESLLNEYFGLVRKSHEPFSAFNPKCVVIAGVIASVRADEPKLKAFELYRTSLKDVEVITFDELVERRKWLMELLKPKDEVEDDPECPVNEPEWESDMIADNLS